MTIGAISAGRLGIVGIADTTLDGLVTNSIIEVIVGGAVEADSSGVFLKAANDVGFLTFSIDQIEAGLASHAGIIKSSL